MKQTKQRKSQGEVLLVLKINTYKERLFFIFPHPPKRFTEVIVN